MKSQYLAKAKLPDAPGIYIFKDDKKRPLYIGRATSLKDRAKSYFSPDLIETRGPRIVDMVTKARTLSFQETGSVLEAILLESELIKRYQPFYNVDERDDKSSNYVVITDEPWPRVFLARSRDYDQAAKEKRLPYAVLKAFGPYPEGGLIKEALKILRKLFPFKDRKAHDPRHEAFYRALGRSPDEGAENARRRYRKTIAGLILFFEGKKGVLRKRLEKEMNAHARKMEFEEADRVKKLLYALDHIRDMALIKREAFDVKGNNKRGFRIEAYDIAHLSGQNVVGAMTVSDNGQLAPSEYRKFKISRERNNDIAGLVEMLSRRLNHPEWPFPDLIVVDGNEVQQRAAEAVLRARRITIPVIAVTKDERHKASSFVGNAQIIGPHKNAIVAVNAEAHRFAIAYHRKKRAVTFSPGHLL